MRLPARIAFGTMHGKAAAVGPPLARLGIAVEVPEAFDTDRFGTFGGEIPRAGSMLDAARAKARAAAAALRLPVGLGSEGAYGAHPVVPFLPFGRELLLWHEPDSGREIAEWLAVETPAFDHALVEDPGQAGAFLARGGFPETALIVGPAGVPAAPVAQGVTDAATLARAVARACALSPEGRARVQTDMRAHRNPPRMRAIRRLAERLAARLACACPACGAFGWGRLRGGAGLPCRACGGPSLLAGADIHGCTACGHEVSHPAGNGPRHADPAHCPCCNP